MALDQHPSPLKVLPADHVTAGVEQIGIHPRGFLPSRNMTTPLPLPDRPSCSFTWIEYNRFSCCPGAGYRPNGPAQSVISKPNKTVNASG